MAMQVVLGVCKGIQWACDGINVVTGAIEYAEAPEESRFEKGVDLALRTAQIACDGLEVGAKVGNASNASLANIKTTEIIVQGLKVPVRMCNAIGDYDQRRISGIRAIEQGILAPIASLARAGGELGVYQEKAYLAMTSEERERSYRLILKPDSDSRHPQYEKRPIFEEECKQNLERFRQIQQGSAIAEASFRLKAVETGVRGIEALYRRLAPAPAAGAPAAALPAAAPVGVALRDPFDLEALHEIPPELHDDPVFARYICPLSLAPIRFPIGDPNGVHVYERAEIIRWININHTSPMTRLPLNVLQLQPKPALRSLIDSRLRFHSERLRQLAQQVVADPADPALEAAAHAETPALVAH